VLILALVLAAAAVVVFVATAGPATAREFATLHPLEGRVEVRAGDDGFRPGTEGMSLRAGDVIRTGEDGRARVTYFDGSETRLDFNTTFRLVELASLPDVPNGKIIEADQDGGKTFQRIREITDSESRVDVAAPTAVASVRGTSYSWWVRPDDTTVLWVVPDGEPDEGRVLVVLRDNTEVSVPEGHGLVVLPDGRAGDVYALNRFELNDPWVLFNVCRVDRLDLEVCGREGG
jgi:FecR protein